MNTIKAKLSRHVLDMKFMRKTKDNIEKPKIEKVHREQISSSESSKNLIEKGDSSSISTGINSIASPVVEELWSYNQCERYIFGRQSFGGFNPTVENNVRKGIWKPFYLEDSNIVEDSDEDEPKSQSDVDVSDEEMAKTFGSLVGTLAKRFRKRHKEEAANDEKMDDEEEDHHKGQKRNFKNQGRQKGKNQGGWKKFKGNKNDKKNDRQLKQPQGETGEDGNGKRNKWKKKKWNNKNRKQQGAPSDYGNQQQQKSTKRQHGYSVEEDDHSNRPPQKKRKFMKPSDD